MQFNFNFNIKFSWLFIKCFFSLDVFLTGQVMTINNSSNKTGKYLFQCDLKISIDLLEASLVWWWTRPDGYHIFHNEMRYFYDYDVTSSTLSFNGKYYNYI